MALRRYETRVLVRYNDRSFRAGEQFAADSDDAVIRQYIKHRHLADLGPAQGALDDEAPKRRGRPAKRAEPTAAPAS